MKKRIAAVAVIGGLIASRPAFRAAGEEDVCNPTCLGATKLGADFVFSEHDRSALWLCDRVAEREWFQQDVVDLMQDYDMEPRLAAARRRAESWGWRASTRAEYVNALAGTWIFWKSGDPFEHVFCGDGWETPSIGGLHYGARYVQLERRGDVCFEAVVPVSTPEPIGLTVRYRATMPFSCARKEIGTIAKVDLLRYLVVGHEARLSCCLGVEGTATYLDHEGNSWFVACGKHRDLKTLFPKKGPTTCSAHNNDEQARRRRLEQLRARNLEYERLLRQMQNNDRYYYYDD